jgi:hypothetical protein
LHEVRDQVAKITLGDSIYERISEPGDAAAEIDQAA